MARDLYADLGVSRSASADEIKRAYKKLATKLHPDLNPGDARAEARFKQVNSAYQVLSDDRKRKLYDEFGEAALREGFNPDLHRARRGGRGFGGFGPNGGGIEDLFNGVSGGPSGFGDLFAEVLRGGAPRGAPRTAATKGGDIQSRVTVDFVDAIRGSTLTLRLQGFVNDVTVRIPKGAADGDKLRVAGRGSAGKYGGPAGDLVLTLSVKEHPMFERKGLDLYIDVPLSVAEAYEGTKVRVPTPDGDVSLTVKPGTQSGQLARLKERGVERSNKRGDLYVRYLIQLPEERSEAVQEAVRTLGSLGDGEALRAGLSFD